MDGDHRPGQPTGLTPGQSFVPFLAGNVTIFCSCEYKLIEEKVCPWRAEFEEGNIWTHQEGGIG